MAASRNVTDEELEEALNYVAIIIDRYGEAYWPIYERLENELSRRRSRASRLRERLALLPESINVKSNNKR